MYNHLQGAREQYFVQLLSWISLMYVCCVFVQCAVICHYLRFVCVWSSCPGEISPGQELQTHIQTDGNDIRLHTVQTHNERRSTESILITAQSTVHEPPEDGHKYGPKHAGATLLKYFKNAFKCFKY